MEGPDLIIALSEIRRGWKFPIERGGDVMRLLFRLGRGKMAVGKQGCSFVRLIGA